MSNYRVIVFGDTSFTGEISLTNANSDRMTFPVKDGVVDAGQYPHLFIDTVMAQDAALNPGISLRDMSEWDFTDIGFVLKAKKESKQKNPDPEKAPETIISPEKVEIESAEEAPAEDSSVKELEDLPVADVLDETPEESSLKKKGKKAAK